MFSSGYFPKRVTTGTNSSTESVDLSGYLKKTDVPPEYRTFGVNQDEQGMDAWYWLDLARKHYQNTMPSVWRSSSQWNRILTWNDLEDTWTTSTKLVTRAKLTEALDDLPLSMVNPSGMETLTTKNDPNFTGTLVVDNNSGDIVPNSVYVCTPSTVYSQNGVSATFALFRIQIPSSLTNMTYLRVYNNSTTTDLRLNTYQTDVVFVRGGSMSYLISNAVIPRKSGATFLFIPASLSPYRSGLNTPLRVLLELDWVSDPSKTQIPAL